MIHALRQIKGIGVHAGGEPVGSVADFLFDDREWILRYVVVDTGGWLRGRQVLVAPAAIESIDANAKRLEFALTKLQIESAPPVDADLPVSRKYERELSHYYGWPQYWSSRALEATAVPPPQAVTEDAATRAAHESVEPSLRSVNEVVGYTFHACDGDVGAVDDFLVDDNSWHVRYVVVDTGTWLSGRSVLVAPGWIESIDWPASRVTAQVSKQQVETSPPYDPRTPLARGDEERLHEHYDRAKYWIADRNRPAVRVE